MSVVRVGFTGTQVGMNTLQLGQLEVFLGQFLEFQGVEFHHGDCLGADAQAHHCALVLGCSIVIHPPSDPKKRAHCAVMTHHDALPITVLKPLPYMIRNRDIVDASQWLVGAPKGADELRSGTWSTIRYARKRGSDVYLLNRDGSITSETKP